jgi:hypothetical protein
MPSVYYKWIDSDFTNRNGLFLKNVVDLAEPTQGLSVSAAVVTDTGPVDLILAYRAAANAAILGTTPQKFTSKYESTWQTPAGPYTMRLFYEPITGNLEEFQDQLNGTVTGFGVVSGMTKNYFLSNSNNFPVIYSGNDTFEGSANGDVIYGYAGNDVIYGKGGNDLISGGSGMNAIDGGSGIDTAVFAGKSDDYALSYVPSTGGTYVIYYTGFNDYLINVENVKFSDSEGVLESDNFVGTYGYLTAQTVAPVFRFYNTRDKAFFYTASEDERDMVVQNSGPNALGDSDWPYIYQGSTFEAAHSYSSAVAPLHRFYNTETGHHFFTTSNEEMQLVKSKSESGEWPFNYEGIAFNVYSSDPNPGGSYSEVPVHRFYSPSLNRHFFTADEAEVAEIELTGIWNYEGIGFWGEVV